MTARLVEWFELRPETPRVGYEPAWRVLHARFPASIATHSVLQDFFLPHRLSRGLHGRFAVLSCFCLPAQGLPGGAACGGTAGAGEASGGLDGELNERGQ
jgi:hypothetical protein